jgi:hypothetical protein
VVLRGAGRERAARGNGGCGERLGTIGAVFQAFIYIHWAPVPTKMGLKGPHKNRPRKSLLPALPWQTTNK